MMILLTTFVHFTISSHLALNAENLGLFGCGQSPALHDNHHFIGFFYLIFVLRLILYINNLKTLVQYITLEGVMFLCAAPSLND